MENLSSGDPDEGFASSGHAGLGLPDDPPAGG